MEQDLVNSMFKSMYFKYFKSAIVLPAPCVFLQKERTLQLTLLFFFQHLLLAQQVRVIICLNCLALLKRVIKILSSIPKTMSMTFPAEFSVLNFFSCGELKCYHCLNCCFFFLWFIVVLQCFIYNDMLKNSNNSQQITENAAKSTLRYQLDVVSG